MEGYHSVLLLMNFTVAMIFLVSELLKNENFVCINISMNHMRLLLKQLYEVSIYTKQPYNKTLKIVNILYL